MRHTAPAPVVSCNRMPNGWCALVFVQYNALAGIITHLDQNPVAGPLDLATPVDDQITMGVLIVHR